MGEIIRVTKAGHFLGWYVRYMDADGKRKKRASHQPSKELARQFLVEIEARVARGLVGIPEPPAAAPTVRELMERFLAEYNRPRIKDQKLYAAHAGSALKRALPTLGDLRCDAVSPDRVAKFRDHLGRKFAPASVRVTLAFLSSMYAWAVKQGIVAKNPLRGIERPTPESSIEFLDGEEVRSLLRLAWERAPESLEARRLAVALELALRVGLRRGELLGLRWRDLDLEARRLTVARSYQSAPKSGKTRHLRLPSACVEPLREWRRMSPKNAAGLVFPGPEGRCYSPHALLGLPQLLEAAGCRVPVHPWHCMRHSFASHFIMQGGNILTLQKILGHSDVRMTLIYAHLAPDFLGEELDRLKF